MPPNTGRGSRRPSRRACLTQATPPTMSISLLEPRRVARGNPARQVWPTRRHSILRARCSRTFRETTMMSENCRRLERLTAQLAETLMTAAICADEIRSMVRQELADLEEDLQG